MSMYTIYVHIFPDGKRYIGCTSQRLEARFGRNGEGYRSATKVWEAIETFGWDNIQHEILATTEGRITASGLEAYYIEQYNTTNPEYGYNTKPGGLGKPLPPVKKQSREKISKSNLGRIGIHKDGLNFMCRPELLASMLSAGYELGWYSPSPEQGIKISKGKMGAVGIHKDGQNRYVKPKDLPSFLEDGWELGGEPMPEAAKKHLSEVNKGKTFSEETRKKLSLMRTGLVLIHKDEVNKRIQPEELNSYLDAGWELGPTDAWRETNRRAQMGHKQTEETRQKRSKSLMGKNVGRKHIHLGSEHKMVTADELDGYLQSGWAPGKPKKVI